MLVDGFLLPRGKDIIPNIANAPTPVPLLVTSARSAESPANAEMARWHALPLPANWIGVRRQWELGHAASAILDHGSAASVPARPVSA